VLYTKAQEKKFTIVDMAFEIRRSRRIRASERRIRTSKGESFGLESDIGEMQLSKSASVKTENAHKEASGESNPNSPFLHSRQSILTRRYNTASKKAALRLDTNALNSPYEIQKSALWPSSANDLRYLRFQRYREYLWRQGRRHFGDSSGADAFILPVKLPDYDVQSPHLARRYDTVRVHTVVHSEGQSPIGMAREFNLASLRATVPEPTPSPRTPNFDSRDLLSAITAIDAETPMPQPGSLKASKAFEKAKLIGSGRNTRNAAARRMHRGVPMRTYSPIPFRSSGMTKVSTYQS
jgi:hypothetical protein